MATDELGNSDWIHQKIKTDINETLTMHKQIIEYTSPLDALIALAKQLNTYENHYQMDSAVFFERYSQGKTTDEEDFVEWAGSYQHYLALHQELENRLKNVA